MSESAPQTSSSAGTWSLAAELAQTRVAGRRRAYLNSCRIPIPSNILEIGAFDNPTVLRQECGVRYADFFSATELRAAHASNPRRRMDRVVDVDYVIKSPFLSGALDDRFDLVIANHVVEHICNPIGWLNDLTGVVQPQGYLFLAVPDSRFTFDITKQRTDIVDLLKSHHEGKAKPDVYDLLRNRLYHQQVDVEVLWAGSAPAPRAPRTDIRRCLDECRKQYEARHYVDSHVHYYTRDSFFEIYSALQADGLIGWRVLDVTGPARSTNEFYVLLQVAA